MKNLTELFKTVDIFSSIISFAAKKEKEGQRLYHYAPKRVDIESEGLLAPLAQKNKPSWKKIEKIYGERAAEHHGKDVKDITAKDILTYMEEGHRGKGGSRMLSFMIEPIPLDKANKDLKDYAGRKQLYSIDYEEVRKAGLIEAAYIVEEKEKSQRKVPLGKLYSEIEKVKPTEWKKETGKLLFKNRPHIFLVIKSGKIPGKYLRKENNKT